MDGKLIKVENGYVLMVDNTMYATDNDKLSFKNCQDVVNGYDLDELASKTYREFPTDELQHYNRDTQCFKKRKAFIKGFQKALEILDDKNFTKEDMRRIMVYGYNKSSENEYLSQIPFDEYIQSLQQTEWDCTFNPDEKDSDGFLILKRI